MKHESGNTQLRAIAWVVALLIGCFVATVVIMRIYDARRGASPMVAVPSAATPKTPANGPKPAEPSVAPLEAPAREETAPIAETPKPLKAERQKTAPRQALPAAPPAVQEMGASETVVPKDVAFAALSCVGAVPEAEDVWLAAINDPGFNSETRNDLIEDLNENGFPDPDHLTMDDLPLIESRIALVEQHGPDAMDDTNADAFMEAYKDLLNMQARLTGPRR